MKANFIISLLLFSLFLAKKEYDLIDGIELKIDTLYETLEYSFFSRANKPNIIKFSLKLPTSIYESYSSLFHIYIIEHNNRNSSSIKRDSLNFLIRKEPNNMCILFGSYTISSYSTNYVEFRFKPPTSFSYISARIDFIYNEYDLYNNKPLDIYQLSLNNTYYLYLEPFEATTINISLIINNVNQNPFSKIYIREFKAKKEFPSIYNKHKTITFIANNEKLISLFSYSINFPNITKYIALEINPLYNISHFNAKFEYPLKIFDLENNIWKTMNSLITEEIYLFFIEATQCANINIELIINNTYYSPFDDINIYEYEQKNNSYNSYILKKTKILNEDKNNDFMNTVSYTVYSPKTNYLAFSIIPNSNINNTFIKINVSGKSYELINNSYKNLTNLTSKNDYYFFIKGKPFDFISVTLTMNKLTTNPFSYIYYQELSRREDYNDKIINKQNISSIINGNKLIVSFSQRIIKNSSQYMNFKFKPSYDIDNMLSTIDITECFLDMESITASKKIYNLKPNILYYIKMYAWKNSEIVIILTTEYNKTKIPFYYLKIYECLEKSYDFISSCQKISIIENLKYKIENNQYILRTQINKAFNIYYDIYIEIKPQYYINCMRVETLVMGESYIEYNYYFIIFCVIAIFLISIIIACCYIKCKESNVNDLYISPLNYNNQNEIMPINPVPQRQQGNPYSQNNFSNQQYYV